MGKIREIRAPVEIKAEHEAAVAALSFLAMAVGKVKREEGTKAYLILKGPTKRVVAQLLSQLGRVVETVELELRNVECEWQERGGPNL